MSYPFERLIVFNRNPGTTEVYWELSPLMKDSGTYYYQLQINRTSNPDDAEWADVGTEQQNVSVLTDSENYTHGYKLDKYYRVILRTSKGKYVSPVEGCFGQLTRYEWKLYQEILRKEQLRHRKVSVKGVLLKRKTAGEPCSCTDATGAVSNSSCPYCYGTGYKGGYYNPVPMHMMDLNPGNPQEMHESDQVTTFNITMERFQGRALGIPELNKDDIWVDTTTSQRFVINAAPIAAQMKRVPIARQVDMTLKPVSDIVYQIPIGDSKYVTTKAYEATGCGYKLIDHNYPTLNGLTYVNSSNVPVSGATVKLYDTSVSAGNLLFETSTDIDGHWLVGYKGTVGTTQSPKVYQVVFEKPGEYGPDQATLSVIESELSTSESAEKSTQEAQTNATLGENYLKTFW